MSGKYIRAVAQPDPLLIAKCRESRERAALSDLSHRKGRMRL